MLAPTTEIHLHKLSAILALQKESPCPQWHRWDHRGHNTAAPVGLSKLLDHCTLRHWQDTLWMQVHHFFRWQYIFGVGTNSQRSHCTPAVFSPVKQSGCRVMLAYVYPHARGIISSPVQLILVKNAALVVPNNDPLSAVLSASIESADKVHMMVFG